MRNMNSGQKSYSDSTPYSNFDQLALTMNSKARQKEMPKEISSRKVGMIRPLIP